MSIIAGPGTGKTKTLTTRIVHMIESGIDSGQIIALTFTNKAAREMQERVERMLGGGVKPEICTFHSLGQKLLRQYLARKIELVDATERSAIIRKVRDELGAKSLSLRDLSLAVSRAKTRFNHDHNDKKIKYLVARYNESLSDRGLHDFDDLLVKTLELLDQNQEVRRATQDIYRFAMVDEFQDTSELQYHLLRMLVGGDNICVIGDPRQAIYGFRGARADIFQRFAADFPQRTQVVLHQNYRSTPAVVVVANGVYPDAPLIAQRQERGAAHAVEVLNEFSEAAWVVKEIEMHFGGTDFLRSHEYRDAQSGARGFSDFAVLYRTHRTSRVLQRVLATSGIPFQVAGEGSPYEMPLLQSIVQSLCYIADPRDRELPFISLADFKVGEGEALDELVERIILTLGLVVKTDEQRIALNQFRSGLLRFKDVHSFLAHVDSIAEHGYYDPKANAVALLTIHAAKGLEFEHVFLIGAEEGVLPSKKAESVNEEMRLFYVALTRAARRIEIMYARNRNRQPALPSRFVTGLDEVVLKRIVDPEINQQIARRRKRRAKRQQSRLY